MTDISKEAVDALLQGVTEGPWMLDGPVWNQAVWSSADNRVCFMAHSNGLDDARDIATARFIAAARELAPALRAALDEAEARAVKAEAERDAANALLRRAKTELELIRSKDCGAVYDILVRIEIDAHLGAKP